MLQRADQFTRFVVTGVMILCRQGTAMGLNNGVVCLKRSKERLNSIIFVNCNRYIVHLAVAVLRVTASHNVT